MKDGVENTGEIMGSITTRS